MMTSSLPSGEASGLLAAHLDLIGRDIAGWLELFEADAIVEFPYAASLGLSRRLEGKAAIEQYFRGTPGTFRELKFRDLRLVPSSDPELAFAEVHGSALVGPTGEPYEQDYVMLLRTRRGRIIHYTEYWNPVPAIVAFGGSVQAPEWRIAQ
jgi:uncharacterized protein